MESFEAAGAAETALVFGIGGGGDVVSTVPTARLLECLGVEVTLGGVIWIPVPRDVRPGPRSLDELTAVEPLGDRVAAVTAETTTVDGVTPAEADVAAAVDNDVLALDISGGVSPLAADLAEVVAALDIDLVVGVDAGGDALAVGDEPGLRSPLTDAVGIGVLDALSVDTVLGVIGYGSDGELTNDELDEAFADLAAVDAYLGAWGLSPDVRHELETILEHVETEASRLPVEAAAGRLRTVSIRGGRREATVSPASTITFYFDPAAVAQRSTIVEPVRTAASLEAASTALADRGLVTEFDLERDRLENG